MKIDNCPFCGLEPQLDELEPRMHCQLCGLSAPAADNATAAGNSWRALVQLVAPNTDFFGRQIVVAKVTKAGPFSVLDY